MLRCQERTIFLNTWNVIKSKCHSKRPPQVNGVKLRCQLRVMIFSGDFRFLICSVAVAAADISGKMRCNSTDVSKCWRWSQVLFLLSQKILWTLGRKRRRRSDFQCDGFNFILSFEIVHCKTINETTHDHSFITEMAHLPLRTNEERWRRRHYQIEHTAPSTAIIVLGPVRSLLEIVKLLIFIIISSHKCSICLWVRAMHKHVHVWTSC